MESVVVGAAFAALITFWWIKKGDWNQNLEGRDSGWIAVLPRPDTPPAVQGMPSTGGHRADIEGLRAVAVLLVLVYHAEFGWASGGFIGVDVFFVLSGFLITSLLLREFANSGTVSLANFWARRARRLLPASGIVLVATLIAGRVLLDGLSQEELARDALAACAFVVNIRFANVGTDYLTSQLPPSPLLHFWSLAVEEQFYMIWPGLLIVLVRVLRLSRRALGVTMAAMWIVSLVLCVRWTTTTQPNAFFLLPARAWELLTGAGLALIGGTIVAMPRRARGLLGWAGVAVIVLTAVVLDGSSKFPGWLALLPVLATAAVINAGDGNLDGPFAVLRAKPLQWLGARSYAIYLWHFPILILADREWGPLPAATRVLLLVLSVVLAALSYVIVENPVRHSAALAASPTRSLVMGAWVAVIGVGAAALVLNNPPTLDAGVEAVAPTLATEVSTTVPVVEPGSSVVATDPAASTTVAPTTTAASAPAADASRDNPAELAAMVAANLPTLESAVQTAKVPSNLSPSLGNARNDLPAVYSNGCIVDVGDNRTKSCIYGDAGGSVTIVLFGDSHAAQWMPALHKVALQNGWRLIVHTKRACPDAEIPTDKDPNGTDCAVWRAAVVDQIAQLQPDLVVMSSYRYKQVGSAAGRDPDAVWREGIEKTVAKVRPSTKHLVLLGDTPTPLGDVPSCLAGNLSNVPACMNSREGAVRPSRLAVERDVAAQYDADFVPTSDWLCTDQACPVIIGTVLVYRDNSHINATTSEFLSPYVDTALRTVLAG